MKTIYKNFRVADEQKDFLANVTVENGIIKSLSTCDVSDDADCIYDGHNKLVLTAGFVDMHAHFRDPGFSEKEVLESSALAAFRGGYTTVCCMANTKPVIDNIEAAEQIKKRCDILKSIDLYPVLSLTKGMNGIELIHLLSTAPSAIDTNTLMHTVRLLSEDGKDIHDDALFKTAFLSSASLGIPVSCHCDVGGEDAAVKRAIEIAHNTQCHLHIAHVSTAQALQYIESAKKTAASPTFVGMSQIKNFKLTCEATPHHIALCEKDAERLGKETFGKVAPPLRTEADRSAIILGLKNGSIDAIATDHAPHTSADKEAGSPGFSGIETAFAVCHTVLVKQHKMPLQKLFSLMSANPSRILGFNDRGLIEKNYRADITLIDLESNFICRKEQLVSRGKNCPYDGMELTGAVWNTSSSLTP
ncbi:MAG: dihydroorotase [Termitinemataceae bacterium]|nr:MAG: dihydroorotase [Termitinemataceae bacterium]